MKVPAKVHLRLVTQFGYAVIKLYVVVLGLGANLVKMQRRQELDIISML